MNNLNQNNNIIAVNSLSDIDIDAFSYVVENLEAYKFHNDEKFEDLVVGTIAHSGKDIYGEQHWSLDDLQDQAQAINSTLFFIYIGHNTTEPPVSRAIQSKVFKVLDENLYYVAALFGYYSSDHFLRFSAIENNVITSKLRIKLPKQASNRIDFSIDVEKDKQNSLLKSMKFNAPSGIQIHEGFHHAAVTQQVIELTFYSLAVFGTWEFSKGFFNQLGKDSAEKAKQLISYWTRKIPVLAKKLEKTTFLFKIAPVDGEPEIEFHLRDVENVEHLNSAFECRDQAIESALLYREKARVLEPQKIIFEYFPESKKWLPSYMITIRKGIITDKVFLFNMSDATALSLGGTKMGQRSFKTTKKVKIKDGENINVESTEI